jgi:hypothetical protein
MASETATAEAGTPRGLVPWAVRTWLAAVVGVLVAGYLGIEEFLRALPAESAGSYGTRPLDIFYYDLQLFVLSSNPLDEPGPYPLLLDIARVAAPAATIYALIETGRALLATNYRRWQVSRRRGNTIVVGTSPAARVLAAKLRGTNRRLVVVESGDPASLREAGAAGADVLYAFDDDSQDSALNLVTAASAAEMGTKLAYAQISDPTLALALRARRLGLPDSDRRHVEVVHLDEVAAKALVRADGPAITAEPAPRVVVVGTSAFGRALIVELARLWRVFKADASVRLPVTLVGADSAAFAADLMAQRPMVPAHCALECVERLEDIGATTPFRVYVCDDDEDLALSIALTSTTLWRGSPGSLVVRLNRLASYRGLFTGEGGNLLDNLGERLRLVGLTDLASDPGLIGEDLTEHLAQTIHERYLREQLGRGRAMSSEKAMMHWHELDEGYRRANRAQARDIGRKLRAIGCTVAPMLSTGVPFAMAADEAEMLARHEHARWCAERSGEGWRLGPRNDKKKLHPDLVPWEKLGDASRDNDRQAIRDMPEVLAEVGLRIVRLAEPPPATARRPDTVRDAPAAESPALP